MATAAINSRLPAGGFVFSRRDLENRATAMALLVQPFGPRMCVCRQRRGMRGFLSPCEQRKHANPSNSSSVMVSRTGSMLRPLVLDWSMRNPITVNRRGFAAVGSAVGVLAGAALAWMLTVAAAMAGEGGNRQRASLAVRKGMQLFAQGDIEGSIEKFDEALELDPRQSPYLWQRGLSLYYVDRFKEGAKQFRDDVAVNPNDTEESIWCFLCEARIYGVEEARRRFLVVGQDRRPIMKKIYDVFRYGGSADEILQGVNGADEADFFYANLYVGLYDESHNDPNGAKKAILAVVESPYGTRSGDYMATLARVHAECRGWTTSSASVL